MTTKIELEQNIDDLKRSVDKACEFIDLLRDDNKKLKTAICSALNALDAESHDFDGEVLKAIAKLRQAIGDE